MKTAEIVAADAQHLLVRLERGAPSASVESGAEVALHADEDGQLLLRAGNHAWLARGASARDEARLRALLDGSAGRIGWIPVSGTFGNGMELPLLVYTFPFHIRVPTPLEIGVEDGVREAVAGRVFGTAAAAGEVWDWLLNQAVLPASEVAPEARIVVAGPRSVSAGPAAFRILGYDAALDVVRSPAGAYHVRRVAHGGWRARTHATPLTLLSAPEIRFVEAAAGGAGRGAGLEPLWQQLRSTESYLGIWEAYNRLEQEAIERRAAEVGALEYTSCTRLPDDTWLFTLLPTETLHQQLEGLREAGELAFTAVLRASAHLGRPTPRGEPRRRERFEGTCVRVAVQDPTVRLAPIGAAGADPPRSGYLVAMLAGEHVRLKRRRDAGDRLRTGRAAMPRLAAFFEGVPVPVRQGRPEDPLSGAALAAFGGSPTGRQVEALRVALDTPDIALIQGPPGTGKTRVIAALEARLAEITTTPDGLAGQILLTSYQHEAVENAAAQSFVFGLPAVKIDTVERAGAFDALEKWRLERIASLEAVLTERERSPLRVALQETRDLHEAYRRAPGGVPDARHLLNRLLELAREYAPPALRDEVASLRGELAGPEAISIPERERAEIARAVRALRTTPESFADDGSENALRVLRLLAPMGFLEDEEDTVLHEAVRVRLDLAGAPPRALLHRLRRVRGDLLDRLLALGEGGLLDAVHHDVDEVATRVIDAMHDAAERSRDGEEAVLAAYLRDLKADPAGVRETLRGYTSVLAATCQQSVSGMMLEVKGGAGRGDVVFDTVLVDEAARANPLDLFIPLSRARRRVVLVGDHRQLPHILDAEVEHELQARRAPEAAGGADDVQRLRTSLFEHLFRTLQEREKTDGIKRTVTLDTQFRMHPVLGAFVSRVFYEPHGEGFSSAGSPEQFAHGLTPYGDRVAAFVHLSRGKGTERRGRSKSRPAEAEWIAAEVRRILTERPDLTVGVISFYRAQVERINAALASQGVVERNGDESYQVRAEWQALHDARGRVTDRLRIGTVDAFQGREFDVVFLSMTRCNDVPAERQRDLVRKYGHLLLENRLCVAMSRQRRLLVVVGDEAMLTPPAAAAAVGGLVQFAALCRGPHGIRFMA